MIKERDDLNQLDSSVILYNKAEVIKSKIEANSYVGEFTRVRRCNIGKFVHIDRQNLIQDTSIGDFSYTGPFDIIFNSSIGKYTSISYGVTIGPPEHDYKKLTTHPFIYGEKYGLFDKTDCIINEKFNKSMNIGNDVWIGCNATILRGVSIGDGAVIGANALVTKDVPPYAIVGGIPAKIIKYRFSVEVINKLLEIKWWLWDEECIRRNRAIFQENLTIELLNTIKL